MMTHLLAALALAQAQPVPIASEADVACISATLTPADRAALLDEVNGNGGAAPVRDRLVARARDCASRGGWEDARRRQAGRIAAAEIMVDVVGERLAGRNFDVAMIDRWIARQEGGGTMMNEVSPEQAGSLTAALAEEGVTITEEAFGNLIGIYLQARILIVRHRAGLAV